MTISKNQAKTGLLAIATLYLFGIFMGAIDTGIVTPARTVIQAQLGIDDKSGIWIINIFTLAYAAAIPIAGKLADRIGRKYIYLISIFLFGLGSFLCGFSENLSSFPLLLTGRVIQAVGGGGIMPIAAAEFGTSFPENKRGMALGLVGGVYGVANIIGSSLGSLILSVAGNNNWQWLFYINLPISVVILLWGSLQLKVHKAPETKKIDFLGTGILVIMILSLLYGLKGIDFFNFLDTFTSVSVYPYLIAFVVLIPLFLFIEKKASDPILNLSYFTNPQILITLILSLIVGLAMMGMVFVPQFSENALMMATGTGGYFVTILGFFAGGASPMSGRLIDKLGAKKVMLTGFTICLIGAVFLSTIAVQIPSIYTVLISLMLIGLGLGFVMGAPLNYMMLGNTRKEDSNSALSTLSLIRSIGTTIAPAIMIGFIVQAGMGVQPKLMEILPQPKAPTFALADEVTNDFNELNKNPQMQKMLSGVTVPDFSSYTKVTFDMKKSSGSLPSDLIKELKTADATTITALTQKIAAFMFEKNAMPAIPKIQSGIQSGIDGMKMGLVALDNKIKQTSGLTTTVSSPQTVAQLNVAIEQMQASKLQISSLVDKMNRLNASVPSEFEKSKQSYLKEIDMIGPKLQTSFQKTMGQGFNQMFIAVAVIVTLGIVLLLFYRDPKIIPDENNEEQENPEKL